MSVESARAFYERVATDEAFQKQLRNAASDDKSLEIVLAAGYSFTLQEWKATLAQISESDDSKLSDAELEVVAGGVGAIAGGQVSLYQPPRRVWSGLKHSIGESKHLRQFFYLPAWPVAVKLSAALLSAALIPMSFTAYYNLQKSLENAAASEYRTLELLATSNASRLDQLIIDIQRVVVQVSTERSVVSFLTSTTPKKQATLRPSMQRTLDNVFRSNPDYDAIYLMDTRGRCLAATDPMFIGQNYAFREYFKQAIQGRPYVSSVLVGETTKRSGLYFSNPVRSESGKIVGVAVLKIRGEEIWAIVNALQVGSQGYAFLVDQQGVIVSHPNEALLYHSLVPLPSEKLQQLETDRRYDIESLNMPELNEAMVNAKEPGHTSYYSSPDQAHQMVGFAPLDLQPWVLGVNKPKDQFRVPLNRLIWQNSRSVLAVGVIAAIMALLLARSIARPIRALTVAAQALEQDKFDPHALAEVSRSRDDIGQLVRVFMHMAHKLRTREQKLKQQVTELRIEIDEAKKVRQVAEITETDYFQQLHKKAQKLKSQAVVTGETETDYFQQLHKKAQKLKGRSPSSGE